MSATGSPHGPELRSEAQQRRRASTRADGSPRRVTRRRGQTRARLLDAAFSVFAERGFGHVRIEDVCDRAGYTRGAFYSNFDDLDELFFALYDQRAGEIADRFAAALATADRLTGAEAIAHVVPHLVLDRDWILIKNDFLQYAARRPPAAELLNTHRMRLRDALTPLLEQACAARDRPDALQDPTAMARAVIAAYDGVMNQALLEPDVAVEPWLTTVLIALLGQ